MNQQKSFLSVRKPMHIWVTACMAFVMSTQALAVDIQQSARPSIKTRPPTGTPLPPANTDIAKTWPPEVLQTVQNALALFGTQRRLVGDVPSLTEIERVLGVKLVPINLYKGSPEVYAAAWRIRGLSVSPPWPVDTDWSFGDPVRNGPLLWKSFQYGDRPKAYSYTLNIPLDTEKFCLDPYEFAIYVGGAFSGLDGGPHNITSYPRAYEWGMFARSRLGRYFSSRDFSVYVDADVVDGKLIDARCIKQLSISGGKFSEGDTK